MDADFTTIEVHGVPSVLPEDRMIDKLTIHFLRPRNGGGEVLRVLYSSRAPHQAFVIFECSDVAARVLQRSHSLQLEGRSFPLKLSRGGRAEVDLPVSTTLDLWRFGNEEAVLSILSRYGLKVSRQTSKQLLLEGTFLKLSAARVKLGELLSSEGQSRSPYPEPRPSAHSAGAVSKRRGSPDIGTSSHRLNGAALHAGSRSPEEAEHSPAYSPPFAMPRRRDDAQSGGSAASFPSDSHPRSDHAAGPRRDRVSFVVDSNVLRYARTFREDRVDDILRAHQVAMVVEDTESAGFSTVVLAGHDAPLVKDNLVRFLTEVQGELRTQEIPLSPMSQALQAQVAKRTQMLSSCYKVLVLQVGDTLQLVGSSSESHEMKQRILGDEVSQRSPRREGMEQERGRRVRRSYSLPRLPSRTSASDSEPRSTEAAGDSPSKYAQGTEGRGSRHGAGGADSTPLKDNRWKRSDSESRTKAKEGRPAPGQAGIDRLPPAGGQTTTEKEQRSKGKNFPIMNKNLLPAKAKKLFSWK